MFVISLIQIYIKKSHSPAGLHILVTLPVQRFITQEKYNGLYQEPALRGSTLDSPVHYNYNSVYTYPHQCFSRLLVCSLRCCGKMTSGQTELSPLLPQVGFSDLCHHLTGFLQCLGTRNIQIRNIPTQTAQIQHRDGERGQYVAQMSYLEHVGSLAAPLSHVLRLCQQVVQKGRLV